MTIPDAIAVVAQLANDAGTQPFDSREREALTIAWSASRSLNVDQALVVETFYQRARTRNRERIEPCRSTT